ncbi:uncharacterized protein G2W53_009355 [Senna tora]|uniref:Uncharacterized protein n=1 Tax=Senna tora TaxID=362788 RepID=A0A835CA17_9FABA|nr:uncharacterized protein G2W53_009355 [Senna tora]
MELEIEGQCAYQRGGGEPSVPVRD